MTINTVIAVFAVIFLALWLTTERKKNRLHRRVSELEYELWRRDHPRVDNSDLKAALEAATRATQANKVAVESEVQPAPPVVESPFMPEILYAYTRSPTVVPNLFNIHERRIFVSAHPKRTPDMPSMIAPMMEIKYVTLDAKDSVLTFELHKAKAKPGPNDVTLHHSFFEFPIKFDTKAFYGNYPHFEGEYRD